MHNKNQFQLGETGLSKAERGNKENVVNYLKQIQPPSSNSQFSLMSLFFSMPRTFKQTSYLKHLKSTEPPSLHFQVFSAVEELVKVYAQQKSIPTWRNWAF
mmetsp:Transcript_13425/g.20730  ORF Transcript_13425/g.20730 Transcript_13425/m.20730 type:complete len:101 (-) Transcript_13425:202-504(-)